MLQPVMELNGLMPDAYDGVSWACCPGHMAWYSDPLVALPGETIEGTILRVDGSAVGAQDSLYVYLTKTVVHSATRRQRDAALLSHARGRARLGADLG